MQYFKNGIGSICKLMATIVFNSSAITATLAGISLAIVSPLLIADQVEGTLVQITNTSNFPSPDTSGIIYLPSQDAFLVTDSEINEMPIYQGFNVFKVSRDGILLDTFSTLAFSDEPTGITINPNNGHCFISDDTGKRSVYEVDPGEDRICLTDDDIVTSFLSPNHTGAIRTDPEDVAYGLDSIFIVDGVDNKVYRVRPGNNNKFDGEEVDDLVSSFDTDSIGLTDPEGITFDPSDNTLFIVGQPRDLIFQTTINGVLLRTIDISSIHPLNPAGLALAPSSGDLTTTSLYLVARGIDNNDPVTGEQVDENDGVIYELSLPPFTLENQAPVVSAGNDRSITFPNSAQLAGSVSDDTLPNNTLTSIWSKQSGPGEVSFTDPNNPTTIASFSMEGTYVLRLSSYDGELTSFDNLSISVSSEPKAPTIRNVPSDYPTIHDALANAVEGDTILLAPGIYEVNSTLYIDKNNISIVSRYVTSGDENDIDTTIIKGIPTMHAIDGLLDQSANLKIIGLTIIDAEKAINFEDSYGEVHYCKIYNTLRDGISFDTNAGGAVTHTRVENAGDDAIDIDTRRNGSFLIAYNELINSRDDSIEIHLYNTSSDLNMHYDIHDNLLSGAGEDGIQLIDYSRHSERTFDIYRNIIQGMPDVGISAMFEETKEDFQGAPMAERVRIYNNYFYNNGYHITGGDNMIILNNIFEAATTAAIKRAKGDSITDYNLFYNNPINTQDTLTGNANIYTNPQRNGDFSLQQSSQAIDAGTPSYTHLSEVVLQIPTTEYTAQNPDMGRYEYNLGNAGTGPVITLIGSNPMKLNLGNTFSDPGAAATDQEDGDISNNIQVTSNVNTAVAGIYPVTYTVTDSDGNITSISRSVIVRDNTIGPVISLLGSNPMNLNLGDTFSDPGVTATDQEDGDISNNIQVTSNINTAVADIYPVTYTVTDSDGNITSISRSVIVRDNTIGPVISLLGSNPMNLNLGDTFSDPGATATDQEDGDLTSSIKTTIKEDTTVSDTYLVTYTVSDSDENSASVSRTVIVDADSNSKGNNGSSGSSGGSVNRTLLLFLTIVLLFRYFRKEKLL